MKKYQIISICKNTGIVQGVEVDGFCHPMDAEEVKEDYQKILSDFNNCNYKVREYIEYIG